MKANELRIGNWVNNNEEDYQITSATILQLERGDSTAKPIPLTEEWLIKFGFKKDDTGVDVFDQDYFEWYQKEFPIIGMLSQSNDKSYIFDENTDTLKIYYVHQLQNLYFALTNEELTMK